MGARSWPLGVGVVALMMGILGGIAGLAAYALYEIEVIGVDTSANLIVLSLLCAPVAILIGLLGARWARKRVTNRLLPRQAQSWVSGLSRHGSSCSCMPWADSGRGGPIEHNTGHSASSPGEISPHASPSTS